MGPLLAAAWMGLVMSAIWSARPRPARPDLRLKGSWCRPVRALALLDRPAVRQRRLVVAGFASILGLAWVPAAPLLLGLYAAIPLLRHRRELARHRDSLNAEIPDVIDLLQVAVASGLNVRLAVAVVARRSPPGPLASALAQAVGEVASGARLADALARVPDRLGEGVRPLVATLVEAERYGGAIGAGLARLADDARRLRQRRAEEAARQVPVKLLFPLVLCVLPAFGLLTVAPLIAGGLRALRLS